MTGTEAAIPEEDAQGLAAAVVAEDAVAADAVANVAEEAEEAHVAKIYGERLIQLPLDLY